MCFMYYRLPIGCIRYGPCEPRAPQRRAPVRTPVRRPMRAPIRMEEEYYMDENMDMEENMFMEENMDMEENVGFERDEMDWYEMEPRENMGRGSRRFQYRHPYRYTCPERVRRC